MTPAVLRYSAFTTDPSGGNPAGVVLDARGLPDDVLAGAPKGYTDAVLDDEFPLSMFFEALEKKMRDVIAGTEGITGRDA